MRKTLFVGLLAVCMATGCSGNAEPPLAASAVGGGSSALNPDGSNMKVTAPTGLSPAGGATLDTRRPTLSFTNAVGRFTTIGLAYEIEVQTSGGSVVYSRIIGQGANTTSHTVETDLEFETNFQYRTRGRLGSDTGPWSALASFPPIQVRPLGRGVAHRLADPFDR